MEDDDDDLGATQILKDNPEGKIMRKIQVGNK